MAKVKTKWWGLVVNLNKRETCAVTTSTGGAAAIAAGIGVSLNPIGWLICAGIFAHKIWIHAMVGTKGVKLHFTWAGVLKNVKRRGSISSCPPIA